LDGPNKESAREIVLLGRKEHESHLAQSELALRIQAKRGVELGTRGCEVPFVARDPR
jgi:hypothetical protein